MSETELCQKCKSHKAINGPCGFCDAPTPQTTSSGKPFAGSNMRTLGGSASTASTQTELELLLKIAENANKTRIATRAIFQILLIQITTTGLAFFAFFSASSSVNYAVCIVTGKNCEPNYWLQLMSILVFLVGTWRAQAVARKEFTKSE